MSRTIKITLIAAILASAGVISFAASKIDNEAAALASAKTSLNQAIASAEQHAGGKATKAEFERVMTGWAYDFEIVNGARKIDVRVDPDTGAVISAIDDEIDRDDDHHDHDERD